MKKWYRYLLYILPLILCFSYFPLIKLGENETMYFELSLPLIWLVVFDVFSFVMVCKKYRGRLFSKVFGSALLWLFPMFVTFSVIWSLNVTRGILTTGVMWVLFFAVISFYELRGNLDANFWKVFWRWFFGSALFVCGWCVVQCILDVMGVSQDVSLLCDGCVYQMFGFPHPNGFSIEPQFMGNLLLAPVIVSCYFYLKNKDKKYLWLFFVFVASLFLTFSRGAIYACVVGLCFLFTFLYFRAKKAERKKTCFSILRAIGILIVAFIFTLNLQGILAASSPTKDTYSDGVAKVLNQLSLGVIDIRGGESEDASEKPVENSVEKPEEKSGDEAAFDGYVAESTDTRLRLASAALTIWRQDFKTVLVGVGIGGAGQALYNAGLSPAPREIVQNEFVSLLLETGLVGVLLLMILIVVAVRMFIKSKSIGLILALLVAYGVSLLFFSGLTNAMQIVLIPGLLVLLG